jgi:hypothetical protein
VLCGGDLLGCFDECTGTNCFLPFCGRLLLAGGGIGCSYFWWRRVLLVVIISVDVL